MANLWSRAIVATTAQGATAAMEVRSTGGWWAAASVASGSARKGRAGAAAEQAMEAQVGAACGGDAVNREQRCPVGMVDRVQRRPQEAA